MRENMAASDASDTAETTQEGKDSWLDVADWQVRIIQLLSLPGIVLAYYLWLFHESKVFPSCTVGEIFDCGQVSGPSGQFSSIGGVSVALIGLLGYLAIFLLVWLKDWLPLLDENLPELMMGVTGLAMAFTILLTVLEAVVIKAFCQYCLVSAGIIVVMFVLSLLYLRSNWR